MQDIKNENRVVSDWLLYYPERLRQHEEQLASVTFMQSPSLSDDIRGTGGTSDPTARVAGQRLKYDSEWFGLIADVEDNLPPRKRIFLELRRSAMKQQGGVGRPGCYAYVSTRFPLVMAEATGRDAEEFWYSEATYKYWWRWIVTHTAIMAHRRGLIKDNLG